MPSLPIVDSFSSLIDQLDGEGIPHREIEGETSLSIPTRLGEEDGVLHIRWEPTPGVVQFIQPLPLVVPPENFGPILTSLHRINHGLAVVGFTFDFERGLVSFRTQAFLGPDHEVLTGLVGALIATSARTAAQFLPEIRQTAFGSEIRDTPTSDPTQRR